MASDEISHGLMIRILAETGLRQVLGPQQLKVIVECRPCRDLERRHWSSTQPCLLRFGVFITIEGDLAIT